MPSAAARLLSHRWTEPAGVAVVAALVLVGSVAEAYPMHRYGGLHLRAHPAPAAFAMLAVPALLLFWRRSHPVAVYLASVAGVVGWAASGQVYGAALVMVLVALFSLAVSRPRWVVLALLGVVGTLSIWLTGGLRGPWGWWGGPQLDMWAEMVAAGAVGAFVAARRQAIGSEHLRRSQLEQARQDDVRRQITSERLRIARELHDVVAHSMAMINVQASAAATLLSSEPARAADSLEAIRRASKDGLRELRSILDVLRQVDEAEPAVALPNREGLQALAEAAGGAGIDVTFSCTADLDAVAPATALAAYRIVQESLTNVIRHAPGARAEVVVAGAGGQVLVDVTNDDRGRSERFADGSGTGLVGMSERARALGGRLDAGPIAGGGFRVHAELPNPTSAIDPGAPAVVAQ